MKIADEAKYIRIPKRIEGMCAQLFIYIGDRLSDVFFLSSEQNEGSYYYPVPSLSDPVTIQCSDERVYDSLALII